MDARLTLDNAHRGHYRKHMASKPYKPRPDTNLLLTALSMAPNGLTMQALHTGMGWTSSGTASLTLSRLEAAGMVTRPERRGRPVRLTDAGREHVRGLVTADLPPDATARLLAFRGIGADEEAFRGAVLAKLDRILADLARGVRVEPAGVMAAPDAGGCDFGGPGIGLASRVAGLEVVG